MHWVSEEGEKQKQTQDLRHVIKNSLNGILVAIDTIYSLCIVEQKEKMSPDRIHTQFIIEVPETTESNRHGN